MVRKIVMMGALQQQGAFLQQTVSNNHRHKIWQLAISILIVLTLSALVFPSSFAQDKMPMGGQSATSPSAAASKTRNRTVNGKKMLKGPPGSQPSTMSGGAQAMPVPMGQPASQPPGSMSGMPKAPQKEGNPAIPDSSEHAKHHPGSAPPVAAPAGGMGGMMDGMGAMMAPAPVANPNTTTVLPIPQNSVDEQLQIEQLANTRVDDGTALMKQGIVTLGQAKQNNDLTEMSRAAGQIRNGLFQVESGLSAHRALAEGTPPRDVTLTWFKQQMNLDPTEQSKDIFGVSWFHFFVMVALSVFAAGMILMYFFKMRRATEVLDRVTKPEAAASEPSGTKPGAPERQVIKTAPAPPPGPVSSGWKGILRVNRIFDETPGVKTYRFTAMDGGPIPFTYLPGQYLSVFPMIDGKRTPRSYTMASSPTQRHYCELTIKRESKGTVSRYLHDSFQEGELLEASGPTGSFTFSGAEAKNIVLIGGGVGITPLMSAIRYLTDIGWPGDIFFLYTCRHVSDFIFRAELERLCLRHPKLHMVVTITQPGRETWSGLTGHLTKELIAQAVPDIAMRRVHICGPDKMMKAVQAALLELDVPASQVKTEAFGATAKEPLEVGEKADAAKASQAAAVKPPPEAAEETPGIEVAKPATSETPPAAAEATPPASDGAAAIPAVNVTFKKSGKSAPLAPDKSILEASEDIGVNIPFECRVGTCGICKTNLLSGAVTMEIEDALTAEEKAGGTILACQAKTTTDCAVDA